MCQAYFQNSIHYSISSRCSHTITILHHAVPILLHYPITLHCPHPFYTIQSHHAFPILSLLPSHMSPSHHY